jgi:hypothetical protein
MRLCIISTCVLITTSIVAASPQGKLRGTIKDQQGAAIARAFVLVHPDQINKRKNDRVLQTNSYGEYSIGLPPGFYDVFVSEVGFSPSCRKVWIRTGQTAVYDTMLVLDPVEIHEHSYILPTH